MATGSAGILKYFKPVGSSSSSTTQTLPDPDGPLSERVPAKAIELVSTEVKQSKESPRGQRPPYLILTPSQCYEVGRRASEHGVTASLRYFSKKYPQLSLKETTVRRLKNLYRSTLKSTKSNDDSLHGEIQELPRKKTGQPLLVTEELDIQIQEYIKELRKCGLAINTSIVIASGCGIIMNKDANLLFENGGGINLTKDWAKYLMKQMGL